MCISVILLKKQAPKQRICFIYPSALAPAVEVVQGVRCAGVTTPTPQSYDTGKEKVKPSSVGCVHGEEST